MTKDLPLHCARRMQRIATGLLVLAACGYAITTFGFGAQVWAGYASAFFEAAMVGAVADWFAVTALFRHPMGIPLWHTAIIPNNKDRLGENLANFLCEHFLQSEQISAKLLQMDIPTRIAGWLANESHARALSSRVGEAARWIFTALGNSEVRDFVLSLSRRGIRHFDIAPLAGQVLSSLTHERRHQALLDAALVQIASWLGNPSVQEKVTELIAREVRALRYLGLDQVAARMATAKLVSAIANTLRDMADDPEHELRLRFDEFVERFVLQLQNDPTLQARVARWRDQLLDTPQVADYVQQLWDELMVWIEQDLRGDDSRLQSGLTMATQHIGERLANDDRLRQWMQGELLRVAPTLTERHREDIRQYVVQRVKAWDAHELSKELEAHIGRDLQFIRINGTVVGGIVGVLIHLITQWSLTGGP